MDRYGLHPIDGSELDERATPCEECDPDDLDPVLFPETFRHWTLVTEDPEAVLDALYKEDRHGAKYLTRVAERLLMGAAAQDANIDMAYRFEFID